MFVRSGQYAEQTPVAPASLQQTAAAWEPSVQQMVREIGGLEMAALEEAVAKRWPFKFRINKVWKAMDAISDRGLHSYLQHHWVIIELSPVQTSHAGSPRQNTAEPHSDQLAVSDARGASEDDSPSIGQADRSGFVNPNPASNSSGHAEEHLGDAERAASATAPGPLPHKRSHAETEQGDRGEVGGDSGGGGRERFSIPAVQSLLERGRAFLGRGVERQAAGGKIGELSLPDSGGASLKSGSEGQAEGEVGRLSLPDSSRVSLDRGGEGQAAEKAEGLFLPDSGKASLDRDKEGQAAGKAAEVSLPDGDRASLERIGEGQRSGETGQLRCASAQEDAGGAGLDGEKGSLSAEAVSAVSAAVKEAGLQLADQGKAWFMRIDRFDKADKWFACPSFETALLSDQARDRHFAPSSEVALEVVKDSPPVFLEFLVPLLVRLSAIKYSVFAKGFHCQWHAKVVTKVAASVAYFVDPCTIAEDQRSKVSAIVTDGKEQARYNSMAAKFAAPETTGFSYARTFPEAPFLKPTFQDVKAIAAANPSRVSKGLAGRPWPDVFLIYKATGEGGQ